MKTHLQQITGFQLQALNDPSLPSGGPGRHTSGNFSMSFSAEYQSASGKRSTSVRLGEPVAGARGIWYWPVVEPVGDGDEVTLKLILKADRVPRANLGRFRLAATTFRDLDLLTSMQSTTPAAAGFAQAALAAAELIDNDSEKAIECLQHSNNKSPGEPVANELLLFLAYQTRGEIDAARPHLLRAMETVAKGVTVEEVLPLVIVKALTVALKSSPNDLSMVSLHARAPKDRQANGCRCRFRQCRETRSQEPGMDPSPSPTRFGRAERLELRFWRRRLAGREPGQPYTGRRVVPEGLKHGQQTANLHTGFRCRRQAETHTPRPAE